MKPLPSQEVAFFVTVASAILLTDLSEILYLVSA